jgi:hypothetical protein
VKSRVLAANALNGFGKRRVQTADESDAKHAVAGSADGAHIYGGRVDEVEDPSRIGEEGVSGFRQVHGVAVAVEEGNFQIGLEPSDLLADRGLGDVQTTRSPAEVQLFGQDRKTAKLPEIHSSRLKRARAGGVNARCPEVLGLRSAA